jgi:hypothetical protein
VLAALDRQLVLVLALGALQPKHDLLGGLGLLVEDGLGLTAVSRLLSVIPPLACAAHTPSVNIRPKCRRQRSNTVGAPARDRKEKNNEERNERGAISMESGSANRRKQAKARRAVAEQNGSGSSGAESTAYPAQTSKPCPSCTASPCARCASGTSWPDRMSGASSARSPAQREAPPRAIRPSRAAPVFRAQKSTAAATAPARYAPFSSADPQLNRPRPLLQLPTPTPTRRQPSTTHCTWRTRARSACERKKKSNHCHNRQFTTDPLARRQKAVGNKRKKKQRSTRRHKAVATAVAAAPATSGTAFSTDIITPH